jgi:hypothetical protein
LETTTKQSTRERPNTTTNQINQTCKFDVALLANKQTTTRTNMLTKKLTSQLIKIIQYRHLYINIRDDTHKSS